MAQAIACSTANSIKVAIAQSGVALGLSAGQLTALFDGVDKVIPSFIFVPWTFEHSNQSVGAYAEKDYPPEVRPRSPSRVRVSRRFAEDFIAVGIASMAQSVSFTFTR